MGEVVRWIISLARVEREASWEEVCVGVECAGKVEEVGVEWTLLPETILDIPIELVESDTRTFAPSPILIIKIDIFARTTKSSHSPFLPPPFFPSSITTSKHLTASSFLICA